MRTMVDLPPEQIEALDRLRKATKLSRTALIRKAVTSYLEAQQKPSLENLPGFGDWKGMNADGVEYQRRLRAEWDRDRDEPVS